MSMSTLRLAEYQWEDIRQALQPVIDASVEEVVGVDANGREVVEGYEIVRPNDYVLQAFIERVDDILSRNGAVSLCRTVGDPFAIDPASPPVVSSAPEDYQ